MPSRRISWSRLHGFYQRKIASFLFKKPIAIDLKWPLISFTFDDFPRSALIAGGAILNQFGLAGTYYAALGLAGRQTPTGQIFFPDDLRTVLERGHELGCHTFSHCHSWRTDPRTFEDSIIENQAALRQLLSEAEFKTFSYPISPPRPLTKARIAGRFLCCRAGGQAVNIGSADLNQLSAYFLEKSRHDVAAVRDIIDRNRQARGWLIFATHDISSEPTAYGCTPEFFQDVVEYAVNSGARIIPVARAVDILRTC
jgi:peptidoglycan/xylan/chitin deacetylase (PgdA/CDA1 family)